MHQSQAALYISIMYIIYNEVTVCITKLHMHIIIMQIQSFQRLLNNLKASPAMAKLTGVGATAL